MNRAKIDDGLNYFSKLSIYKVWNMLVLRIGYLISIALKKPVIFGYPESTAVEPTTSCNLRCPECPSGLRSFTRETGMLQLENFKKIVDEQKSHLTYMTMYFQGEPYLNPAFLDCISYANKNKIYTATSTNAHYLSEEKAEETVKSGLDRLIISIDGTSQETYQSYRVGGTLQKVLDGTKNIVAARQNQSSKKPYLIFQFLVVKPNEHQIEEVKKLANDLGVDEVKFKTAQIYDYKNGSDLIPTIDYYSRYKKVDSEDHYELKNKQKNLCWRMWHSNVITWDGDLIPCCFDKDANHVFGNLNENKLKTVLKGKESVSFKKQVLSDRKQIEICRNCSEGTAIFR